MDSSTQSAQLQENLRKFYPAVYGRLVRKGSEKNRRALCDMLEQGIAQGLFIDRFNRELAITVLYQTAAAIATHDLYLPEGITQREAFLQIIGNFFRSISTAKGLALMDDGLRRLSPGEKQHL